MQHEGWKRLALEGWVFVLIAVMAFVGGLLVGDLGGPAKTETVYVSSSAEGEAAGAQPGGTEGANGRRLFTDSGCGSCHTLAAAGTNGKVGPALEESLATDDNTAGIEEMIIHPNAEVVEGYPPNVMPQDYGQILSTAEVHALAEFVVANTPAKP